MNIIFCIKILFVFFCQCKLWKLFPMTIWFIHVWSKWIWCLIGFAKQCIMWLLYRYNFFYKRENPFSLKKVTAYLFWMSSLCLFYIVARIYNFQKTPYGLYSLKILFVTILLLWFICPHLSILYLSICAILSLELLQ